jgi:membrane fusion protein (multidrug efflux system)
MKCLNLLSRLLFASSFYFVLQSCNSSAVADEKKNTLQVASVPLSIILLQEDSFSTSVQIPGELAAFQQVDLYAKVNSFVKKLYVDAGSKVKAGQLLATLEAPEINSQLSGAASRLKMQEAVYTASKAIYSRLLETSKTPGTISPNDLEQAFARQKSDEALLDVTRAQYSEVANTSDYLEVRAPFSGVIISRNISTGAYVGPSGRGSELPMFTLVDHQKLRLIVSVPESYTRYLNNNSEVLFLLRSLPKDTFTAKIARQTGALDNRLRAERIEMDVINADEKLLPGMVAEVIIPLTGEGRAFVVPAATVLNSTEGVFVIKVQNKKTVWVPVTTTRTFNGRTEIYGKLAVNDTLVRLASEEVRNGAIVETLKLE